MKMKSSLLSIAALLAMFSLAHAADTGQPAPDFSAKDIAGAEQSLSLHKGKIVVLEWNNPECPFVVKHYGSNNMQQLQQYAKDKGVVWLTINSGAPGKQGNMNDEQAKAYLAKSKAAPSAYILDPEGKIGKLYGAKTTPHMFVIDAAGNLAYAGAIDDKPSTDVADIASSKNYVKAAIDELQAGKPVSTAQTQAYGCSVKY